MRFIAQKEDSDCPRGFALIFGDSYFAIVLWVWFLGIDWKRLAGTEDTRGTK